MHFVKMHGIENDYVYLDAVSDPGVERLFAGAKGARLIRRMSDRHTGIGSDGVILVCRATKKNARRADVRMRMFNADGSESEMCGNGIRCVAKFAHDRLGVTARPMRVETGRGVLSIDYKTVRGKLTTATVDMGKPRLRLPDVPVLQRELAFKGVEHHWGVVWERAGSPPWGFAATFVSMGNPHAVVFENGSKDFDRRALAAVELWRIGPQFEKHPAFPKRVNVHFAAPVSRKHVVMRTWERGAGQTRACGTGACAVLVAGVLTGRLSREARVTLPGGDLELEWDARSGHVFMTGPATDVFEGEWEG